MIELARGRLKTLFMIGNWCGVRRMRWLVFSLITLLFWGFGSVLSKITLDHMSWQQLSIISASVGLPIYLLIYLYYRPSIPVDSPGFYPALIIGLTMPIALMSNYLALSEGKLSVVVPLISLYPVVTVAVSLFVLSEKITLTQGLGIVFAIVAIILFSL